MSDMDINILEEVFEHRAVYKECLHNHAAAQGGVGYDGCPEFLQLTTGNAINCAVYGCHRNYHRKSIIYYDPTIHQEEPPVTSEVMDGENGSYNIDEEQPVPPPEEVKKERENKFASEKSQRSKKKKN